MIPKIIRFLPNRSHSIGVASSHSMHPLIHLADPRFVGEKALGLWRQSSIRRKRQPLATVLLHPNMLHLTHVAVSARRFKIPPAQTFIVALRFPADR
jgi:hypothetical protein